MIVARLFKIISDSNNLDVEIQGENIYYTCSELGKSKNGEILQMEGIQLDNYKKKNEIEKICREISDNLKILNQLLNKEEEK